MVACDESHDFPVVDGLASLVHYVLTQHDTVTGRKQERAG